MTLEKEIQDAIKVAGTECNGDFPETVDLLRKRGYKHPSEVIIRKYLVKFELFKPRKHGGIRYVRPTTRLDVGIKKRAKKLTSEERKKYEFGDSPGAS